MVTIKYNRKINVTFSLLNRFRCALDMLQVMVARCFGAVFSGNAWLGADNGAPAWDRLCLETSKSACGRNRCCQQVTSPTTPRQSILTHSNGTGESPWYFQTRREFYARCGASKNLTGYRYHGYDESRHSGQGESYKILSGDSMNEMIVLMLIL